MSKMKKLFLSGISVALVAAVAIGGTLAYLTHRDSEVNTFTVGDVAIELTENFEQGAELIPGVRIEKEVSIKNTGKNDAWVWYTYAVPTALVDSGNDSYKNAVHFDMRISTWDIYRERESYWLENQTEAVPLEKTWHYESTVHNIKTVVDGVDYTISTFLYNGTLAPDTTTTVSLEKVYLDKCVDIAPNGDWYWVENGDTTSLNWNTKTNGAPMIYVSAYAIQADEFDTVKEAYDAYNKQWGENGTEYAPIVKEPSEVIVTPENLPSVDFSQDDTVFKFRGAFAEDLTVSVANGLNQIFDATKATFEEGTTVAFNAPGVAHSYSSLKAERSGALTIKGFNVETINVLAYNNEEINIVNNTTNAISVIGGNFALDISNNNVNGKFGIYNDGENQANDYAISLRITDYELSIKGNTITDAYSHAIGINGRQGEASSDWGNCGANNKITAFSGNNITVNSTQKTGRAALKIWCDQAYAPYATSGHQPNAAASKLMSDIKADTTNVITLGDTHTAFNIFDYKQ